MVTIHHGSRRRYSTNNQEKKPSFFNRMALKIRLKYPIRYSGLLALLVVGAVLGIHYSPSELVTIGQNLLMFGLAIVLLFSSGLLIKFIMKILLRPKPTLIDCLLQTISKFPKLSALSNQRINNSNDESGNKQNQQNETVKLNSIDRNGKSLSIRVNNPEKPIDINIKREVKKPSRFRRGPKSIYTITLNCQEPADSEEISHNIKEWLNQTDKEFGLDDFSQNSTECNFKWLDKKVIKR